MLRMLVLGGIGTLVARRTLGTLRDMLSQRLPRFVYDAVPPTALGVPVFTYHSVANSNTPDAVSLAAFRRHIEYLAANEYHTLTADEVYGYLHAGDPLPPRSVALTFDDGRATLWTVVYPLLAQYGLRAICFLVPGLMAEHGVRPTLADYEAGRASLATLLHADMHAPAMITWEEARRMHDSGLVDFQSHTLHHTLIYYTPEIVDFVHPGFDFGYDNVHVPVLRHAGEDHYHSRPPLGTPLYRSQPRMGSARRFFDDEGLRAACVAYVAGQGARCFQAHDWRRDLACFVQDYRRQHTLAEYTESPEQQAAAIEHSLRRSKALIEGHLPGHVVRHLCYPWHRYSILAATLAYQAGYVTSFIDINPQKPLPHWNNPYAVQRLLPSNEYGDDPYQITRIDARSDAVVSLPGQRRLSYARRVARRWLRAPHILRVCR